MEKICAVFFDDNKDSMKKKLIEFCVKDFKKYYLEECKYPDFVYFFGSFLTFNLLKEECDRIYNSITDRKGFSDCNFDYYSEVIREGLITRILEGIKPHIPLFDEYRNTHSEFNELIYKLIYEAFGLDVEIDTIQLEDIARVLNKDVNNIPNNLIALIDTIVSNDALAKYKGADLSKIKAEFFNRVHNALSKEYEDNYKGGYYGMIDMRESLMNGETILSPSCSHTIPQMWENVKKLYFDSGKYLEKDAHLYLDFYYNEVDENRAEIIDLMFIYEGTTLK